MRILRVGMLNVAAVLTFLLALQMSVIPALGQQKNAAPESSVSAGASSDAVLQAMREEIDRSKTQLKMDNVPAPYYIEYRLSDADTYEAESAFGAPREEQRFHFRNLRVVVRVGDYKQDSYYGQGMGVVDLAPLENDSIALRHQLWMATDRAYKSASEALAMKKAMLRQYAADQPFDRRVELSQRFKGVGQQGGP